VKKETRIKIWMYWEIGFGTICGLFSCVGIIPTVDKTRELDERTYWAVLTLILIFFFKWGIEEYRKAKKELKEMKQEVYNGRAN